MLVCFSLLFHSTLRSLFVLLTILLYGFLCLFVCVFVCLSICLFASHSLYLSIAALWDVIQVYKLIDCILTSNKRILIKISWGHQISKELSPFKAILLIFRRVLQEILNMEYIREWKEELSQNPRINRYMNTRFETSRQYDYHLLTLLYNIHIVTKNIYIYIYIYSLSLKSLTFYKFASVYRLLEVRIVRTKWGYYLWTSIPHEKN